MIPLSISGKKKKMGFSFSPLHKMGENKRTKIKEWLQKNIDIGNQLL